MEQMKRKNSVADGNKKKKVVGDAKSLSRNSTARFEDLSNEIIYEIFEFLDFFHVYEIFSNLNIRFQNLLIYSNFLLKIKHLSTSKSTFQRYHTQIIIPNQHRIKSLYLSNPFIIDGIFSSTRIELKLTRLETLILNKISSLYVENLLKYLLVLPYLSSLIINCEDEVQNKNNLYKQIFRLPALKYCKLSLDESNQPEQLPIATKGSSPIEHFILNSTHVLNDLNNLLSYIPHLNRLSIHSSYDSPITQIQLYSVSLIHLTHVSLNRLDIPFDQLEFMIQSLFNQVQVLHISNYCRSVYLDANRWQRLILSYMPHLRIFDIFISYTLNWAENIIDFITMINMFNSSFWFKRRWFFEYQVDKKRDQNFSFYSTNPYRRKQYILYEEKNKNINRNRQKMIMNFVQQIEIRNEKAMINCQNYFPNVTGLIILFNFGEQSKNLLSNSLNNIIPLNQLTKFILRSYHNDFYKIIELLQCMPNIHTFEIGHTSLKDSNLVSIQQSHTFRLVSQTNKIQNMIIECQCTLKEIQFLINLCPQLQQLTIDKSDKDFESFLRCLLSNINEKLNYLFLLCIASINQKETNILETLIKSEKLLHPHSPQIKYHSFNRKTYLWF
ncbi:unnamed protein product [Rotaria sordida]|uniref:F-box domain-containing protein n=1 Tax=Rotaria sordida TaxID=392033 RepID=A0A819W6F4_9BILA|nr:unnamed protein product [Rotaria sordida]CAF4119986.1 unnamed protein product [Rotaria sordida]